MGRDRKHGKNRDREKINGRRDIGNKGKGDIEKRQGDGQRKTV